MFGVSTLDNNNNNEYKRDEQMRKERIELDKVKQGLIENVYAEEKKKEVVLKPKGTKQKLKNFWYHYKGAVIIAVALVTIGGYFAYDIITKPEYDATVVVATDGSMYLYQELLEKDFSTYAKDYNGDGKLQIGAAICALRPKDTPDAKNEYAMANRAKLTSMLASGEHILFLIDDVGYEHITQTQADVFINLSEKYPDDKNVKGDRFYIKGTKLEKYLIENGADKDDIPKTLSLCVRDPEKMSDSIKNRYSTLHKGELALAYAVIDGQDD